MKLSTEVLDGIVSGIIDNMGGVENITYNDWTDLFAALEPIKKAAFDEKRRYERKIMAIEQIGSELVPKIKKYLKVGDRVSYVGKTHDWLSVDLTVKKITEKRFQTDYGHSGFFDFSLIRTINGIPAVDYINLEEAKSKVRYLR